MPTTNPKVSGYIPQHLYDFFTAFCEERGVSMSKGVALLFAEYFGVNQSAVGPDEVNSVAARLQDLEEKVSSLLSSPSNELLSKINDLSYQVEALNKRIQTVEESKLPVEESELLSKLSLDSISSRPNPFLYKNELPSELPNETKAFQDNQGTLWDRPLSEPSFPQQSKNANLAQEESSSIGSTESKLPQEIQPIPGVKLSTLRFGIKNSTFRGSKSSKSNEDFIEWTRKKDPDGIPWKYVEAPLNGYVPAEELPSELLGRLLKWINENIEPKQS